MKFAIDISNYSGFLSPETAAKLRGNVDTAIVRAGPQSGLFDGDTWKYTRQQLLALQQAGFVQLDAYVYLNFGGDPAQQVTDALGHVYGFPIQRLWLDCEDTNSGKAPHENVQFIQRAVEACGERIACGIYTGRWWWVPHTDNSTAFSSLPLWVATDDEHPDLSFPAAGPFGGWAKPMVEQYHLDTTLWDVPGVAVDLNVYDEPAPVPSPEPPPPPEPAGDLIAQQLFIEIGRLAAQGLEALK